MTIADVFDETQKDGNFAHHMSNFGQIFLWELCESMIANEPQQYPGIDKDNYVFAACFIHYWADVFMLAIPKWVHKNEYKHSNPRYTYDDMKQELERLAPHQFKAHNKFMTSNEVMCL